MEKIIPALIFYLITASTGIESITLQESSKQEAIAIDADSVEKAVYRELNYKIKTKILWTGKIGWGHAKITEKQSKESREIKVKLTGVIGWLAKRFQGCDEIISLISESQQRKYIEFKKEYCPDKEELDPLIYCMDLKHYIKQSGRQKMIADGKRWWIWTSEQGKKEVKLDGKLVNVGYYRLNFLERKNNNPACPLDFYFFEDEGIATKGKITFLKGALQIEGYLVK